MNESKIKEFLDSWAKGVIDIGKSYLKKEDFEKEALKFLSKHYAFKTQHILFKPTFTKEKIFRNNLEEALSYFCLLYTSPSPRDDCPSRMPSSA